MHEADTFLQLRLLVLRRRLQRTTEVVEDRDQLLDEPLVRTLAQRELLARVPLAVVVELCREPLQAVEELIPLGLESLDVETLPTLLFLGDLRLVRRRRGGCRWRRAGAPRPSPPPPPPPPP